jgi:hypothetical protein
VNHEKIAKYNYKIAFQNTLFEKVKQWCLFIRCILWLLWLIGNLHNQLWVAELSKGLWQQPLYSIALRPLTELNWTQSFESYSLIVDPQRTPLTYLQFCMMSPCMWHVPLLCVYGLLPNNGSTCYIAPFWRIFVLNSLQVYNYFFFLGLCLWCLWLVPPSPWLGSYGEFSPTAPTLRPLVLSGSRIRCELVQVYHHQPQSRVLLDSLYHIYPDDYLLWALWGWVVGWFLFHAVWVIAPHFAAFVVARTVGESALTSFHSVTGKLHVLAGIIVDSV